MHLNPAVSSPGGGGVAVHLNPDGSLKPMGEKVVMPDQLFCGGLPQDVSDWE